MLYAQYACRKRSQDGVLLSISVIVFENRPALSSVLLKAARFLTDPLGLLFRELQVWIFRRAGGVSSIFSLSTLWAAYTPLVTLFAPFSVIIFRI